MLQSASVAYASLLPVVRPAANTGL